MYENPLKSPERLPPLRIQAESYSLTAQQSIEESEQGEKPVNQDVVLAKKEQGLYGIFDGVGGHAGGGVAALTSAKTIESKFSERPELLSRKDAETRMAEALGDAHRSIRLRNTTGNKKNAEAMATTAAVVQLIREPDGKTYAVIGNVGDSRVYRRREGKLEQITIDDSYINRELREQGADEATIRANQTRFSNAADPVNDLDADEFAQFSHRNIITGSLGIGQLKPTIFSIELKAGDELIIVSDGVSDNLTDEEIAESRTAFELVNRAQARSLQEEEGMGELYGLPRNNRAHRDDTSAIVLKIEGETTPEYPETQASKYKPGDLVTLDSDTEAWLVSGVTQDMQGKTQLSLTRRKIERTNPADTDATATLVTESKQIDADVLK